MHRILPFLFLAVTILPASAADRRSESKLVITGWGNETCASFTSNAVARSGATDWVMGFLSGVNWEDGKNRTRGEETTNAGIAQWLDGYCRTHPTDYIMQAAMTLTISFEKKPAKAK